MVLMKSKNNILDLKNDSWHVTKNVHDFYSNKFMKGNGKAFTNDGYFYEMGFWSESDLLLPYEQTYKFIVIGSTIDIYFNKGQYFFNLNTHAVKSIIHHQCFDDYYNGYIRLLGGKNFYISWLTKGPRKHYRLQCLYKAHNTETNNPNFIDRQN